MGRYGKSISSSSKIEAAEKYLRGQGSQGSIAREYGVDESTLREWVAKYEAMGPSGLITTTTNNWYDAELKTAAVEAYLRCEGSLRDICLEYKIRSKTQLRKWIMLYNKSHIDPWAGAGQRRRIPMTKGRKTTLDERVEIVGFCIANGKDYGLTMEKFGVSYQQIYSWVRKYEEHGVDGLVDQRGKRKPLEAMSEVERLRAENKMLRAENKRKEMENAILKKLQEIERRRF
jgi:transposase-like protein